MYSDRFDAAVAYAVDQFRKIRRKGTEIPYITHLFTVAAHEFAQVAPRPRERHAPALDAVGSQLTQRHAARAHEEAAD